jgi:hypothetical protein
MLRSEYRYRSSVYYNPFQDAAVKQDGYSLANARLQLTAPTATGMRPADRNPLKIGSQPEPHPLDVLGVEGASVSSCQPNS